MRKRRSMLCPVHVWAGLLVAVVGLTVGISAAHAAPTPPPSAVDSPLTYDARALALGGAGSALGANGALALHNPALIDQVGQRAVTATFTPYFLRLEAPFRLANRSLMQAQSGLLFGPFTQLGMIVRLTSRVSVGMVAYVTAAAGGSFDKVPLSNLSSEIPATVIGDAAVAQVAGELLVPVAVTVTSWLKLGAAYRITHAYQMANLKAVSGAPISDASLHGSHFTGFAAGALAQVGPRLRLGLSYRSQVAMDMSGSVTPNGVIAKKRGLHINQGFFSPQRIKVGAAWRPAFARPIMFVAEARLWLHQLAHANERATLGGALAAEYTLNHRWSTRLGYSVATQPTTDASAKPFAVPPGLGHGITAGGGLNVADWKFDAAVGFILSGKTLVGTSNAGRYRAEGAIASLAATYAL